MDRNLNMVIIADHNTAEARALIEQLQTTMPIPQTVLTPLSVKNFFPFVRANPAVGILLWASDMQGLATDVEDFGEYIKNEAENKQALADAVELAQAYVDLMSAELASEA